MKSTWYCRNVFATQCHATHRHDVCVFQTPTLSPWHTHARTHTHTHIQLPFNEEWINYHAR